MTSAVLSESASAATNKATLEAAFTAAGDGGTITIASTGTYLISDVQMPADRILDLNGSRFLSPVLASGRGTPMVWVLGADCRITNGTFDGQRDNQPADGFSDSVDGGGHQPGEDPRGRAYRCAIRADISSGIDGQADPHRLQVDACTFQRLYGAGVVSRGGNDTTIDQCLGLSTNFEVAHISQGDGTGITTITNNRLWLVGSGDASVNADGFIVGGTPLVFENNKATSIERALLKVSSPSASIRGNRVNGNNVYFRGDSPGGLVGSYPAIQIEDCANTTVSNNHFTDVGSGVYVSSASASGVNIHTNTILGTNGDTTPDGILIQSGASNITINNNVVTDAKRYGVHVTGAVAGLEITNNALRGKSGSSGVGIWLVSASEVFDSPVITGNNIAEFSGLGGAGVLGLFRSGTGTFSGVTVSGNTLDATGAFSDRAIFWHQASDYISGVISGNVVTGVLSTSTNANLEKINNTVEAVA